MPSDPKTLAAQAQSLKAQGRLSEALSLYRDAVAAAPASASAEHNLAAALGDAGRWPEAERHMRAAFAKGASAPESWLVLARCLQARGAFNEAERAFRAALERRPTFADAHLDLAQLLWIRTGDATQALAEIERALAARPEHPSLLLVRARILENTRGVSAAYDIADRLVRLAPDDLAAVVYASQLAAQLGDDASALGHADHATRLAPLNPVVSVALITACLAAGDAARAATHATLLLQRAPHDQHAIALLATAWRMLGDPRYRTIYDYGALVRTSLLETPAGWPSLPAYLADLKLALARAHISTTHPFNQSVRHGSQAPDVLGIDDRAIAALPAALASSIMRYVESLGAGDDPLRRRNFGGYAFQGMWSIRMQSGGHHVDHVHPNGWISSACYIEVPDALPGQEGWIRFGAPGIRTSPALGAEHVVAPKPGMLVLFPSYMWHGVNPYTTPATRMTFAFDLAPARRAGAVA